MSQEGPVNRLLRGGLEEGSHLVGMVEPIQPSSRAEELCLLLVHEFKQILAPEAKHMYRYISTHPR